MGIKKVAELFSSLAAKKLREEKVEKAKAGVGKKEKVQLKGTGKAHDMNNNKAMITDVMGDDYDQEYYGNEGGFNRFCGLSQPIILNYSCQLINFDENLEKKYLI